MQGYFYFKETSTLSIFGLDAKIIPFVIVNLYFFIILGEIFEVSE